MDSEGERLTYGLADFGRALAATESELRVIADEIGTYDFAYRYLSPAERDGVLLRILTELGRFTKVGAHRSGIWESCWSDAKKTFIEANDSIVALDPVFMGAHPVVRMHGDYARPDDPRFETHWFRLTRKLVFARYLTGARKVFEFGCGSGFNLAAAAQMFPELELMGLDWSPSAVELIDRIGHSQGFNLKGRRFDFFDPDPGVPVDSDTLVLTNAALEQTGDRFVTFAEWLLARRPRLVLSMEPILDFYDPDVLFDHMAVAYHTQREYLNGYYGWVRDRAAQGQVEIVEARRLGFGSLYHEAYSLLVWRPL